MRFLLILVLIAAAVLGLGLYRGWFTVSSNSHDSKPNINLSVDQDKIQEDKDKVVEGAESLGQQAKDKAAPTPPEDQD